MKDGIFVSYSHSDSTVVEQIVSVLKKTTGKEVWFDHKLRGGENYFSVIANQIVSNKYFVFIVSDNSIESDWCLRELEFAASEKRRIIAIWLDNISISPRIKLIIQNTHYINWYSTTSDFFSESVSMAFDEKMSYPVIANSDRDLDELSAQYQKYYLDNKEMRKIIRLLQAEKNEQYSVCFIPENANLLGIAYELGVSVEKDYNKASFFYKASKYFGDADGQYLYSALKRDNDRNNQEHIASILDAADHGGILALTYVGDCYYEGTEGFPLDKNKAYGYYERAARAGGTVAMYYTAYGYTCGECLQQDYDLAYMYALKAKEKGFPRAYRLLGFMYRDGLFVEKNLLKSVELFKDAINRGDYISYCHLGYIYGEMGEVAKKVEVYKKAAELAKQGKIKSGMPFYRLAVLYEEGSGVERDYETAAQYYLKAAERKHESSRKYAVSCILQVEGEKRLHYLQEACTLNCDTAARELGLIEKGKRKGDKEKLSDRAIGYFVTGAEQGDIICAMELLWNYSYIIGNGQDRNDRLNAIKWFRFFFANVEAEFIKRLSDNKILATYYYAYAIELDYDPDENKPDREFVLYNFKKSVEDCPKHLRLIISFAVDGYLFPENSGSGLVIDVPHAEEILNFAAVHLDSYYEYISSTEPDRLMAEQKATQDTLRKGYTFISKCYKCGKYVAKDKERANRYRKIAKQMEL